MPIVYRFHKDGAPSCPGRLEADECELTAQCIKVADEAAMDRYLYIPGKRLNRFSVVGIGCVACRLQCNPVLEIEGDRANDFRLLEYYGPGENLLSPETS